MQSFKTSQGHPKPFGSTVLSSGINFSIFSRHAEKVSLVLFKTGRGGKFAEIDFDPRHNKTGNIWHILVHGLDTEVRYGFRIDGPRSKKGVWHEFSPDNLLIDPFTKALSGGTDWGTPYIRINESSPEANFKRRCLIVEDQFDWEGDRPLIIPLEETIIYELHVRGFTRHSSAGVTHPGTYAGVVEKIPYLKELGVTAVELMPVAEFNENEIENVDPITGLPLKNFWGYSPQAFFSPKAAYAVNGRNGHQVVEFKEMVKALHSAGIEVILDVVFNHTAEGGTGGPTYSFKGIDNSIYYLLNKETGEYLNFSGCGNTMNCNHPVMKNLIIDCLHYWVQEMHVDGFRFDLASVFGRDKRGEVMENSPLIEAIAEDPILASTKIIAEAWDAGGLYQVGRFSDSGRWAEWNGKFRDDVRAFICGREDTIPKLATRIAGSSDLYEYNLRHPINSINFITSHDGFTLSDLVSYNTKHNLNNGENNRDGTDHNISWNSGAEGPTKSKRILQLRERRMRTLAVILLLSQGVPMFVAGEEFGRTQNGNNNTYCQDNPMGWVDWNLLNENAGLFRFFRLLIKIRKTHSVFRRSDFFLQNKKEALNEIVWQSLSAYKEDWSPACKTLGVLLYGGGDSSESENDFFIMLNGDKRLRKFNLPVPRHGGKWKRLIDTGQNVPDDIYDESEAEPVRDGFYKVQGMGAVVLISSL
ncbi:MAG: glycogen debranching protein GlgX [Proteobacteria bacterium]|nr:glycogen debranching protein GlgX [Pseudomonadota bacterium]MBU1711327.1 glycogen debranching protein GlgX [Pseudomonadota bacterium]